MYLTNKGVFCQSNPADKFFFNVTVAHDKGKPAVRRGRKAVSLPKWGCPRRLSGCRRRSERDDPPASFTEYRKAGAGTRATRTLIRCCNRGSETLRHPSSFSSQQQFNSAPYKVLSCPPTGPQCGPGLRSRREQAQRLQSVLLAPISGVGFKR